MQSPTGTKVDEYTIEYSNIGKLASQLRSSINSPDSIDYPKINSLLISIQEIAVDLISVVVNRIKRKNGHIRSTHLSSRMNFSGRAVIVPFGSSQVKAVDEIEFNYTLFAGMYIVPIANRLIEHFKKKYPEKIFDISDCYLYVQKYTNTFNETIYNIMQSMVNECPESSDRPGIRIAVNRPPTNDRGSLLICRITSVSRDIFNYTMRISNSILKACNGDYDGDAKMQNTLTDGNIYNAFSSLDPRCLSSTDDGIAYLYPQIRIEKDCKFGINFRQTKSRKGA